MAYENVDELPKQVTSYGGKSWIDEHALYNRWNFNDLVNVCCFSNTQKITSSKEISMLNTI